MDFLKLKEKLKDVAVTTVTPFTDNLTSVNTSGIESNLEFLVKARVRLIVPCGNTGEYYSLSVDEWKTVLDTTVNCVPNDKTVIVGVGGAISSVLKMVESAKNLGAAGIMVMYPRHVFSSEEGLLNYYTKILEAANNTGVVLYKKGELFTDRVVEKLTMYNNLIAIKYAYGRIVDFARSVRRIGKGIVWSCGIAERFAPFFWLAGAEGFTSGLGNFAPRISLRMLDTLQKNDYGEALKIQELISPLEYLREGRDKANNVPVVKTVMDSIGLTGGACRPPIHPLSNEERKFAIEAVASWISP